MRKLTWACDNAQLHHGLAVTAITEGGVSKKHVNTEGYTRTVKLTSEDRIVGEGSYYLELDDQVNRVIVKTHAGGCVARWKFVYPAWKLEAFSLRECQCGTMQDL